MAEQPYVEEIFELVGTASRCWAEEGGKGVFDEVKAIEVADRLCEIVREQVENVVGAAAPDPDPETAGLPAERGSFRA